MRQFQLLWLGTWIATFPPSYLAGFDGVTARQFGPIESEKEGRVNRWNGSDGETEDGEMGSKKFREDFGNAQEMKDLHVHTTSGRKE